MSVACEEGVVERSSEGDGEEVGGDVFEGEVTAEEDLAEEGEAEGVDGCDGDEAGDFDDGCDGDRECGEGLWAEFGKKRGEKPVEGYGPEDGAQVFVEEPR